MRLRSKNKGFTLLELVVVIVIMGIIIAIILGNSGEQRQKAQLEETAGAVRDFLIEAGAVSSKIQMPIRITTNERNELIATYAEITKNAGGVSNLVVTDTQITNWESGRNKFVSLTNVDRLIFRGYQYQPNNPNSTLFARGDDDLTFRVNNGGNQTNELFLNPRGSAFADRNINLQQENRLLPYILIVKGKYAAIIEVVGNNNINMYVSHLTTEQASNNGARAINGTYYSSH